MMLSFKVVAVGGVGGLTAATPKAQALAGTLILVRHLQKFHLGDRHSVVDV